jgi:class 3 adenylate cyclase
MPLQLIGGERKQVTVMFVDVVRSMELTRAMGAERWREVLDGFLTIAREAIDELGGTVNQFHGDGLMAVFGAPLAHEDHARRACLAALELRERVAAFAEALEQSGGVVFSTRCGLGSGEVIVGSIGEGLRMDFAPIGNTGGLGKRIESLAPEGPAALSASTAALVEGEFAGLQRHIQCVMTRTARRISAPYPYWRQVKLPVDRALDRSMAEVYRAVEGFIAAARERLDEQPERYDAPENLLEGMLAAQREDSSFTDEEIANNVVTLQLRAGTGRGRRSGAGVL